MITGNFVLALAYTGPYQLIGQNPGSLILCNLSSTPPQEKMDLPYFGIYGTKEEVLAELTKRVNIFFDALEKEQSS